MNRGRPVAVLNVAEKPSVARGVTSILSGGNARSVQSASRFNPVKEFQATVLNTPCNMFTTSAAGHIMKCEYIRKYPWVMEECDQMFDRPIQKSIPDVRSRKCMPMCIRLYREIDLVVCPDECAEDERHCEKPKDLCKKVPVAHSMAGL